MDLLPDLGEPGILDELLYFGPLVLQVVLGVFFFWLATRWMKEAPWYARGVVMLMLVFVADVFLVIIFVGLGRILIGGN